MTAQESARGTGGSAWDALLRRVRPGLPQVVRLTSAAVLAYLVAVPFSGDPPAVLAPLTAMLVVQTTAFATVASGFQRVGAVIAGVVLALLIGEVADFRWWSLALVVSCALSLGQLFRLGDTLLEVPISAMLVLSVGAAESAATGRVLDTVIGASVGILFNLLLSPPTRVATAEDEIADVVAGMSALLRRVAGELRVGARHPQAQAWTREARTLAVRLPEVDRLVEQAEQSLRLNPRATTTLRTGWSLRPRLYSLESAVLALVALVRAVAERVLREPEQESVYSDEVRVLLTGWLDLLAEAVDAFGRVAATSTVPSPISTRRLTEALEEARALRPRVADLLLVDVRSDPQDWEAHGAVVLNADRLVDELDVDRYARVREAWLQERVPLRERSEQAARVVAHSTRRWGSRLPALTRSSVRGWWPRRSAQQSGDDR